MFGAVAARRAPPWAGAVAAGSGGTINATGSLDFRVTRVGADTVLERIVAMVRAAQGAKLPIQALVDKVVAYFVPAVLVVAALTFVAWLVFGQEGSLSLT